MDHRISATVSDKTLAQLTDQAATLLQYYVRIKFADFNGFVRCVTCGAVAHYKDMDGGHFIPRKWAATKLVVRNVHPQCKDCNGPKRGNLIPYTLYMSDTYGRRFVDDLYRLKHTEKSFTREELGEYIHDIKRDIENVEREKGFG